MRLTIRTNLAMRILMVCAVNADLTVRTADIAEKCNASLNHLLHVVSVLQAHGLIETLRGRSGGLRLARPSGEIVIGRVLRLFENGVPLAECFDPDSNTCPLAPHCRLRGFLVGAVNAFYREMDRVTLEDLVSANCGLETLLSLHPQPVRCNPADGRMRPE
ncbi:transcriptional regulator, BadM/Rrf2 family [Rhizobium sp. RU35A]|uniref:RrF2 family transcriptional regulator n=1 Tax=Rhizobium sp. RU35A TaxID=1907414 RepID=UPI000956A84A|nr:Rrf2 family transcriptional regulator [Rhizobium sp. RU35A]SIQ43972.1 transcriptional regulator, BadM/Rrf2 family [Rhizobium sp. RU35A]